MSEQVQKEKWYQNAIRLGKQKETVAGWIGALGGLAAAFGFGFDPESQAAVIGLIYSFSNLVWIFTHDAEKPQQQNG